MFADYKDTDENGALLYGYEYYTSGYGLSSANYLRVHHTEVPYSLGILLTFPVCVTRELFHFLGSVLCL